MKFIYCYRCCCLLLLLPVVVVVAALWLFCALKALHLHRNGQSVCANSSKPTSATPATPATATSTTTQLFNIIKYFALSGMHTNAFYMSIAVSVCVF